MQLLFVRWPFVPLARTDWLQIDCFWPTVQPVDGWVDGKRRMARRNNIMLSIPNYNFNFYGANTWPFHSSNIEVIKLSLPHVEQINTATCLSRLFMWNFVIFCSFHFCCCIFGLAPSTFPRLPFFFCIHFNGRCRFCQIARLGNHRHSRCWLKLFAISVYRIKQYN